MSLLSRMFGRRDPEKPIGEMSLAELIGVMRQGKGGMPARDLIEVSRRVTDIALFEHGVSDVERSIALELLPALDDDIEAGLRNESGAWEAYKEAAIFHRSGARHCGYGSLQWKMDEEGVEAAEVIPFIARADHAELLPAFLEMLEPDVIRDIRGALLNELAAIRARNGERPLDVLSRLASGDDGALTQLLDGTQLGALRRAQMEPEIATEVLRGLGVSP
jgi:hypothetical protein